MHAQILRQCIEFLSEHVLTPRTFSFDFRKLSFGFRNKNDHR